LTSPRDVPGLVDFPDGAGNLMTIHLFSSCPMGEDRSKCATDSFGRVHGHRNLRIADASLLCTPPAVNPQGSIMALARRTALHFLNNRKDLDVCLFCKQTLSSSPVRWDGLGRDWSNCWAAVFPASNICRQIPPAKSPALSAAWCFLVRTPHLCAAFLSALKV